MTKKSQFQNRPIVLVALAVLTVILGAVAWIAASRIGSPELAAPPSQLIAPDAYQDQFGGGTEHLLIDVRTPEEFSTGHIPGSVNINVETLANRLDEVPAGVPIVVYCRSGNRSATAAQILVNAGFSPVFDLGGIQQWVAEGYPTE